MTPEDYAAVPVEAGGWVLPEAFSADNILTALVWGAIGAVAFALVHPIAEEAFWGRKA